MLVAQAEPFGSQLIQALAANGFWMFLGICVLAGTAKHVTQLVLRHRERIAMIENGMYPDTKADASEMQPACVDRERIA